MSKRSRKKTSQNLSQSIKALEQARAGEDQKEICLAVANLGLAYFRAKKFKEGERCFREAKDIAKSLDDFQLTIRCLGVQTFANQTVGRLPTAYQIAQEIEAMADEHQDLGVQVDALASQGQILIESGDELAALEKLTAAQELLDQLDDPRRKMNLLGAFGNYSMTIAAAQKAQNYFEEARQVATEIGDRNSEIGFHGNIGTILEWKGDYDQAAQIFADVYRHVHEAGNREAEIQALRHLTHVHIKKEADVEVVKYAQMGVDTARKIQSPNIFYFYEHLIKALYRQEQFAEAHSETSNAIETARELNDRQKEVDFLLSLGESYMLNDKLEQALEAYQQALEGTQCLQRMVDRAYLFGRVGVILAELDRPDEALDYHEKAVELARKHEIRELEGEQIIMLAMAFFDKEEYAQAQEYCQQAIAVFQELNLDHQIAKTRQLIAGIEVAQ